ncbi:MAG: alpha/beta fold hydrolase [Xanthobacteraceae bacterium]|nr:alpha/beta fold hydrolase [Xanthobacteraceae bacterium]
MIPSDTAGISLFVRNKRPRGMTEFCAERTLLFVHGSTYPAETSFDLALDGLSWMDYIAGHGYDVYLVDVRGYGESTRPPEMEQPAHLNAPIVRADTAIRDVGSAVDFILERRRIARLNLLGWSWGTTLMGGFAAANNDKVNKLALYAPQWIRTTPSLSDLGGELGAYRLVSAASARDRWLTGVPEAKRATLIPPGWFETWLDQTFATDTWGNAQTPKVLRAPNGTVQDSREVWAKGRAIYDPSMITVPVLLVHADWDQDLPLEMTKTYFALLTNARYRRWVEIGEGTHSIIMEKNRMQLFRAVQAFLDEAAP